MMIHETLPDGSVVVSGSPDPVPEFITNYQARKALRAASLLAQVDVAMKQAGGDVLDAWEYANFFYRTDPIIAAMGPVLGLDAGEIDALFINASTIA